MSANAGRDGLECSRRATWALICIIGIQMVALADGCQNVGRCFFSNRIIPSASSRRSAGPHSARSLHRRGARNKTPAGVDLAREFCPTRRFSRGPTFATAQKARRNSLAPRNSFRVSARLKPKVLVRSSKARCSRTETSNCFRPPMRIGRPGHCDLFGLRRVLVAQDSLRLESTPSGQLTIGSKFSPESAASRISKSTRRLTKLESRRRPCSMRMACKASSVGRPSK